MAVKRYLPLIIVILGFAILLSQCGGSQRGIYYTPPPKGLPSFYAVAHNYPIKPGFLIKYEKLRVQNLNATVYRIMYESTSQLGAPIAVTGLVYVPHITPPKDGFNVISWSHGTNGMAPICAPSLNPDTAVPSIGALLSQSWVVVATDYQGEGTPGLLPYIAGKVAAQNSIDAVRAAKYLPGLKLSGNYVEWGHSEGGQTAMFVWDIAKNYAPQLHLMGVVAGAPPSQLGYLYSFLTNSVFKYYVLMAAAGLHEAYQNQAPLSQVLTPLGISLINVLKNNCAIASAVVIDKYSLAQLTKTDPFKVPAWHKIINENDPNNFSVATGIPLLIIQGGADEQIPTVSTQLLASHLCKIGAGVQRWIYPGETHGGVIGPSTNDMITWIKDKFNGIQFNDSYTPVGPPVPSNQNCKTGFF
jgi:hypothetical protein